MASRRDTSQRKTNLKQTLAAGWRKGEFRPGEPAPSLRELAQQFELSRTVVTQVLQELVQDGVLYTVPSVGTFFGQPTVSQAGFYLSIFQHPTSSNIHFAAVQAGFEESIARKGGLSLSLSYVEARDYLESNSLPELAGIFEIREAADDPQLSAELFSGLNTPYVRFSSQLTDDVVNHNIAFDNFDGGCQATGHLLQLGHKKIAFIGLHQQGTNIGFRYSVERERGWQNAMQAAGLATKHLSFLTSSVVDGAWIYQMEACYHSAMALVKRPDVTAVVTVSHSATVGLCEALKKSGVPNEQWPLIVSFDDEVYPDGHVISTMKLPWRELGQQAASLLWDWNLGKTPETRQHMLPMRMIPRLTSQPAWANALNVAKIQSPPVAVPSLGTVSG